MANLEINKDLIKKKRNPNEESEMKNTREKITRNFIEENKIKSSVTKGLYLKPL
jgi:hypothetical protein